MGAGGFRAFFFLVLILLFFFYSRPQEMPGTQATRLLSRHIDGTYKKYFTKEKNRKTLLSSAKNDGHNEQHMNYRSYAADTEFIILHLYYLSAC